MISNKNNNLDIYKRLLKIYKKAVVLNDEELMEDVEFILIHLYNLPSNPEVTLRNSSL